jgi:hypothetical protein
MFGFFKMFGAARDGDRMFELYERALDSANRFVAIKLAPGGAKIASAILNDILSEDALKGNGVEAFRAQNGQMIEQKAKQLMEDDPEVRELMGHTLWVKWLLDKAYHRDAAVVNLEKSWAFSLYSEQHPPLTLKEYEALVERFEDQTAKALAEYLEAHLKHGDT